MKSSNICFLENILKEDILRNLKIEKRKILTIYITYSSYNFLSHIWCQEALLVK